MNNTNSEPIAPSYDRLMNDYLGMVQSRDKYKKKYKAAKKLIREVKFKLAPMYVIAAGMASAERMD